MNDGKPLRAALVGMGKMGAALGAAAAARGVEIALRIDPKAPGADAREIEGASWEGIDVALEFTAASSAADNCRALLERGVPVVSGTTGWNAELREVRALAAERQVGFLWASNFSLGVQTMMRLVDVAASWFGALPDFAPYLVEAHHRHKLDAPSGTARTLAEKLVARTPGKTHYGLAPADGAVPNDMVPVAWIRAGAFPGEHTVGWDAPEETVEIVHRARSRAVFAHGAVAAAAWLVGRRGPCTIDDFLDDTLPALPRGTEDHR